MKKCSKCNRELATDNFNKRKGSKDGFQSRCRFCEAESNKQYRNKNKEKLSIKFKEYRAKNIEKLNNNRRHWYSLNIEHVQKYRQENKERDYIAATKWRNTPSGHAFSKATVIKRRLILKNAGIGINKKQWEKCKRYFDFRCAYCGSTINIEQDHIIPVSNGGKNVIGNIIPSCRKCNRSKAVKNIKEWYLRKDFYLKANADKIIDYIIWVGGKK